jgi:hypothetical protein
MTDDTAAHEYIKLKEHGVDIVREGRDEYIVWLNTGVSDFDGLVIGSGYTRDEAVADAVGMLEAAASALQQPKAE